MTFYLRAYVKVIKVEVVLSVAANVGISIKNPDLGGLEKHQFADACITAQTASKKITSIGPRNPTKTPKLRCDFLQDDHLHPLDELVKFLSPCGAFLKSPFFGSHQLIVAVSVFLLKQTQSSVYAAAMQSPRRNRQGSTTDW